MAVLTAPDMAVRQPQRRFDFSTVLEERAAPVAWLVTVISTIARGASFYSGGALVLSRVLGPMGLAWFDGISGVGIAGGAEILSSVAGRAWRRNKRESLDVAGRQGLKRNEREAMIAHYESSGKIAFWFMCAGFFGTLCATFGFFLQANPDHSIGAILNELLIAGILVSVVSYLGIFHEPHKADPREMAESRASDIQMDLTEVSGRKIAAGIHTPSDVQAFAEQLPAAARDGFRRALLPFTADDPAWGTSDICNWLGINDLTIETERMSQRRQVNRKLSNLQKAGAPVLKGQRGQWQIARSQVMLHFADDFSRMRSPVRIAQRVTSGLAVPLAALPIDDTGATGAGHSTPSGGVVLALVPDEAVPAASA